MPRPRPLVPVADTFSDRALDTGEARRWDHGAAQLVKTSNRDAKVHIAYLKFDLGGVSSNVRRATLDGARAAQRIRE